MVTWQLSVTRFLLEGNVFLQKQISMTFILRAQLPTVRIVVVFSNDLMPYWMTSTKILILEHWRLILKWIVEYGPFKCLFRAYILSSFMPSATKVFITHIDGLVQDCSNSSALALELLQSCPKPSIWIFRFFGYQQFQIGFHLSDDII